MIGLKCEPQDCRNMEVDVNATAFEPTRSFSPADILDVVDMEDTVLPDSLIDSENELLSDSSSVREGQQFGRRSAGPNKLANKDQECKTSRVQRSQTWSCACS